MGNFSFSCEPFKLTVERVTLRGNLDRSIDWNKDVTFLKFRDQVREKSAGKIVVLDLSDFGTWDTEGIEEIVKKLIEPLVLKGAKIGICGSKTAEKIHAGGSGLSQIYEDALLKQGIVGTDKLPWEEDIDGVLSRLTS